MSIKSAITYRDYEKEFLIHREVLTNTNGIVYLVPKDMAAWIMTSKYHD